MQGEVHRFDREAARGGRRGQRGEGYCTKGGGGRGEGRGVRGGRGGGGLRLVPTRRGGLGLGLGLLLGEDEGQGEIT
jgi:hypothetical protein